MVTWRECCANAEDRIQYCTDDNHTPSAVLIGYNTEQKRSTHHASKDTLAKGVLTVSFSSACTYCRQRCNLHLRHARPIARESRSENGQEHHFHGVGHRAKSEYRYQSPLVSPHANMIDAFFERVGRAGFHRSSAFTSFSSSENVQVNACFRRKGQHSDLLLFFSPCFICSAFYWTRGCDMMLSRQSSSWKFNTGPQKQRDNDEDETNAIRQRRLCN